MKLCSIYSTICLSSLQVTINVLKNSARSMPWSPLVSRFFRIISAASSDVIPWSCFDSTYIRSCFVIYPFLSTSKKLNASNNLSEKSCFLSFFYYKFGSICSVSKRWRFFFRFFLMLADKNSV